MQKLIDVLQAHGIAIVPDFSQPKQRAGSQWLFARQVDVGSTTVQVVDYGDFKTDIAHRWFSTDRLSPEETRELNKKLNEATEELKAFKKEQWDIAREYAKAFIQTCADRGSTEYLDRKKVSLHRGAYIHTHPTSGSLVVIVPLMDVSGEIWSYQRIFPKKLSFGDKFMQEGGRIEGLFFPFGFDPSAETPFEIYIAEGYATAATIYETISAPTVAAINAWNIIAVAKALREKFPAARLIICADNDAWTVKKTKEGKEEPYNTGLFYSKRAADETRGELRYPAFQDTTSKPTDFNDLYLQEGANAVREQLANAKALPEPVQIIVDQKPTRPKKPNEVETARAVLSQFGDRIVKQDHTLFVFEGTHWNELQLSGMDEIKKLISKQAGHTLGDRDVNSTYRTLVRETPHVPHGVDLFRANRFAANFKNGTLHLKRNSDHSYKTEFRPHEKSDFLTSTLPFDYPDSDTRKITNEPFEAMLKRIWDGDPDQEEKIRLYAQVMGACLVSAFPQFIFFVGPAKTGKSTLILLAARLVSEANRCSVDPGDFNDFNMETMVNKLVNFDTDIDTKRPMKDSILKKVIDGVPMRIRRKNISDIYGTLPAVHLFGGNDLPKSFDGSSRAYERRAIIIRTDKFQPTGFYDKEYHDWVFEQSPQGVINFAIRGLEDLIASKGHYHVPRSAYQEMADFQNASDPIGAFFEDVKAGKVVVGNDQVMLEKTAEIGCATLWKSFVQWHEDEYEISPRFGRRVFFERLRYINVVRKHTKSGDIYLGIGYVVTDQAAV